MSNAVIKMPATPELDPQLIPNVSLLKPPTSKQRHLLIDEVRSLLKEKDASIVAHYYTDADIQMIAEETGGYVSDSLDMAKFGHSHPASTLIVAGVRFMGETAKILSPEKRILMPTLDATCSLDLACPVDQFTAFCDKHPDRTVIVYANTSAAVKARADWVVTSSIAIKVIEHLASKGEKIIWAPDKHLGGYIKKITGADMLLWQGSCIVHEAFQAQALASLKAIHSEAAILVHPESPDDIIRMADVVGSTTQLINAARSLKNNTLIVATDNGIFYKMQQAAPDKLLLEAPTVGVGATCVSCAHCPWMEINTLQSLSDVLKNMNNEIFVDEDVRKLAYQSTKRMLDFSENLN